MSDRIAALERMLEQRPDDARLRFGLALEYERAGRDEDVVSALQAYLRSSEDEGNAWGRLAAALERIGRIDEAREALQTGVAQALAHGHPTMADEFRERLTDLT